MVNVQDAPFRHVVVDDMWDDELVDRAAAQFPAPDDRRWHWFRNGHEYKAQSSGSGMYGRAHDEILAKMGEVAFASWLGGLFGMQDLSMDTLGGGLHLIPPGGHLGIHYDFNRRADGWHRRLNVLLFLNRGWRDEWGGHLELWDTKGPKVTILPSANRMVVFETSERSWHGHPYPLTSPEGVCRRSIAAYFYTQQSPPGAAEPHSTVFHPKSREVPLT